MKLEQRQIDFICGLAEVQGRSALSPYDRALPIDLDRAKTLGFDQPMLIHCSAGAITLDAESLWNEKEMTIPAVISTESSDRMGDTVMQQGGDWAHFLNNPIVPLYHDYSAEPVGTASKLLLESGRTMGLTKFNDTELGRKYFGMYQRREMRAWSIGFYPKTWEVKPKTVKGEPDTFKFTEWEGLEYSAVAIPANPEALTPGKEAPSDEVRKVNFGNIVAACSVKQVDTLIEQQFLLWQKQLTEDLLNKLDGKLTPVQDLVSRLAHIENKLTAIEAKDVARPEVRSISVTDLLDFEDVKQTPEPPKSTETKVAIDQLHTLLPLPDERSVLKRISELARR